MHQSTQVDIESSLQGASVAAEESGLSPLREIARASRRASHFISEGLSQGSGTVLHAYERDFSLVSGARFESARLGYCLYGANPENPLVVVHPALTGSPRACREQLGASADTQGDGWWHEVIGAGRLFDTEKYTVMCVAHLGGNGHSSSARELHGAAVSFEDTVNLTARVLATHGFDGVAAIVGGSMGAFQAMHWLHQEELSIGTIVDLCGSAPRCDRTSEFFALQRDLLAGHSPGDIASRLRTNCSDLTGTSAAFDCALAHVASRIVSVGGSGDERTRLAAARQIGFLRFVAPGFYDDKLQRYLVADKGDEAASKTRLTTWLDRQGEVFGDRFDAVALRSLVGMLATPREIDTATIAAELSRRDVVLKGLSVDGDTLWPRSKRVPFYSSIGANLPESERGRVRHVVVSDPLNGHDFFLSQSFASDSRVQSLVNRPDDSVS